MRDLSMHLMDILQNSVVAEANQIIVSISTDSVMNELVLKINDNGVGMDKELMEAAVSPFFTTRTTRKIGLGIPLLIASSERASGKFTIDSQKEVGTTITASFKIDHIDRLPIGNIAETIVGVVISNQDIHIILFLKSEKGSFKFDTDEIKEKLGEVSIGQFEVIDWMQEYINEGIEFIFGGVLNEITC